MMRIRALHLSGARQSKEVADKVGDLIGRGVKSKMSCLQDMDLRLGHIVPVGSGFGDVE